MNASLFVPLLLALALCPLLFGVINKTKAFFAGRAGQPMLQAYFDLWKLLRKGAVYSRTTTWVFRAGPLAGLAAVITAAAMTPLGSMSPPIQFPGAVILLVYLLGLMRFFTVLAALDTGSAFEGMGASREVTFSALAEPVLLLALATVARLTGSFELATMFVGVPHGWLHAGTSMVLVLAALFLVFLAENARIPVDDPNTHLELTMIHEVMVLDHGGPDFGFVQYGAALKLWVLGSLLVGIAVPFRTGEPWIDMAVAVAGLFGLAVTVGVVESTMARLRMNRVPQLLAGAGACSVIALALVLGGY